MASLSATPSSSNSPMTARITRKQICHPVVPVSGPAERTVREGPFSLLGGSFCVRGGGEAHDSLPSFYGDASERQLEIRHPLLATTGPVDHKLVDLTGG